MGYAGWQVGRKLAEVYWKPGNGVQFLDLVESMTGAPLTGKAWVAALREPLEDKVASEKNAFKAGLKVPLPAHLPPPPAPPPSWSQRSAVLYLVEQQLY